MLLDSPALQLRYTLKDVLGIVESVLKGRHWRKFDIDSTSLVYVPHWFFNFDVYQEAGGESKTYSSQMALDATTGKLNPMIIGIMNEIPTKRDRELTHGIKCDVLKPAVQQAEVKEVGAIKVAGETGVSKKDITISGINLIYVPYWQIWVRIPAGLQRIDLDGISGSPVNIEKVPTRERGNMEITMEMLEDLKTPKGWVDYSTKAFNWGFGHASKAGEGLLVQIVPWFINTQYGRYTALILMILVLLLILKSQGRF